MARLTRFAMLALVSVLGVLSPAHAADLLVSSSKTDRVLRYNGTTGTPINAFVPAGSGGLTTPAGLAFSPDGQLHVANGAFISTFVAAGSGGLDGPAKGDFRLAAGSPAMGAGAGSRFHSGIERVPAIDFEGDPRPQELPDLPSIGFDERP